MDFGESIKIADSINNLVYSLFNHFIWLENNKFVHNEIFG